MADVALRHEITAVADARDAAISALHGAAVHRNVLADFVVLADDQLRRLALVGKILRRRLVNDL